MIPQEPELHVHIHGQLEVAILRSDKEALVVATGRAAPLQRSARVGISKNVLYQSLDLLGSLVAEPIVR